MDNIFGRAKLRFVVPTAVVSSVIPFLFVEPSEATTEESLRASLESVSLGIASFLAIFLVLWVGWCARSRVTDAFGRWPKPREAKRLLALGIPSVGIALLTYYMVFFPLSYLAPELVLSWAIQVPELIVPMTRDSALTINLGMLLLVVLIAPLVEEFVFRGFLLGRLGTKFGMTTGIVASSTLFALLHPDFLGSFVFSCLACLIRLRFEAIAASFLFHASHNAVIMLLLVVEVIVLGIEIEYTLEEFRSYWWCAPLGAVVGVPWMYRYCRTELLPPSWNRTSARVLTALD